MILQNQTVKWLDYYGRMKTFYNQLIEADDGDLTVGKWGDRAFVLDENGVCMRTLNEKMYQVREGKDRRRVL